MFPYNIILDQKNIFISYRNTLLAILKEDLFLILHLIAENDECLYLSHLYTCQLCYAKNNIPNLVPPKFFYDCEYSLLQLN